MDLRPLVGLWTVLMMYSLCYSNGVLDSAADDLTGISAEDPTAISMEEQHANSKTDDLNTILDKGKNDIYFDHSNHSQKLREHYSDNATFSPKPANSSVENSIVSPKLTEISFGNTTFSPKLTEFVSDNSTLSPKSTEISSTKFSDISTVKTTRTSDTYSTTTIFNKGPPPLTSKQGGDSALISLESYLPELDRLCPGINVCGRTRDDDSTVATTAINNCCSNCSCESSCFERQNCCYDNISTDGQQKMFDCLMPVVGDYDSLDGIPSYRFVVAPPMDGCKTADNITIEKIRNFNGNVSPWGDFYPVYSKSFDLNFKNEKIAFCHGTRDIEKWKLMAIYRGFDDGGQGMTHFLRTFNSSDVFIVFEPPRPEIIHREYTCMQAIGGTCPIYWINTFKVPSYIQTNRKGIVAACEQGPRALYWQNPTFAFKNVYCAICNSLVPENNDSVYCRYNGIERRHVGSFLVTLLSGDFIDTVNFRDAEMRDKPSDLECYRPESHMNYLQCVQLQCPMFQIRLTGSQCGYQSAVLLIDCIYIQLNLTTTQTIDISFINNLTEADLYSMFQRFSPWKRCWDILRIGLRIETNKTEFAIHVSCKAEQFELKHVYKGLKKLLSKPWVVPFTNIIQFKQQLDKHGDTTFFTEYVSGFKHNIFSPSWTVVAKRSSAPFEKVLWKPLYRIQNFKVRFYLKINKLFFCHQIELGYSEYEIRFNILYFKNMSRHLYPGEYSLFHDEPGSQRVLVCLDDSGYIKAGSGTRAMCSRFLVLVVPCLQLLATLAYRILGE